MLLDEQKTNRHEYIGGSDVPIILGASKFKNPWDLLLEKTLLKSSDFGGSIYSELGNILEPRIQNGLKLINVDDITYKKTYKNVPFECHIDGLNPDLNEVQEIKVANQTIEQCYEAYHWQVRTYMFATNLNKANLILLKRQGKLKDIVTSIIKEYDLGNLHDFGTIDQTDVEMALKDLNYEVDNLVLYPSMFQIQKITRDELMEEYFLEKVALFWDYKLKLDNDNTLVDDVNFKNNFMSDFNY